MGTGPRLPHMHPQGWSLEKPQLGPIPPAALIHTCLNHIVSQPDNQGVGPICLKLLSKLIKDLVELG